MLFCQYIWYISYILYKFIVNILYIFYMLYVSPINTILHFSSESFMIFMYAVFGTKTFSKKEVHMEHSKPTIKDIAALADVSIPTVHKAIYGKPGISEATRQRILSITKELNYTINTTASRLKRGVLNIAIVLPRLSREYDQFFRKMWEGVERAEKNLADYNATLIPFPCGRTSETQIPIFEELLTREDISGVITYCWDDKTLNSYFEQLKQRKIPVVTVDSDAVDSCRIGCVRASGKRTGRLAAELLSKMVPQRGRVIIMSGNIKLKLLRDNTFGFCNYIAENRPDLAILNIGNECGGLSLEDTLVQELGSHADIVGIYCNSASNVLSMCRALERSGKGHGISAVASDIFEELEPYLDSGLVDATIWQAPELQVQGAIWMLYDYLIGHPLEKEVQYVKLGIVMKHNFKDYLIEDSRY